MHLIIKKDYDDCAQYVGEYIASKILNAKTSKSHPFVLGLPTGSTPLGVYANLIKMVENKKLSFKDVVTFNMDEYVGLSKDNDQSYHYFMMNNFFNHIDIQKENIHILDGMAKDLEKECLEYEKKIKEYSPIALFFGGVGVDGHIAFNEPFSHLASRTHVHALAAETIRSNSRFFGGECNLVPKFALTVGVATIMDADEVLIMATGHNKARAVKEAIEGAISSEYTITALQLHKNATIVCDEDASCELRVGTYKYFKKTNPI